MYNFCADVLRAIYHEKVQPASEAEDFELQIAWETVLKAVVSSILVCRALLPTVDNS